MACGRFEHQALGARVVKGDLHQGIAAHLLDGEDHALAKCLVHHHISLAEIGGEGGSIADAGAAAGGDDLVAEITREVLKKLGK